MNRVYDAKLQERKLQGRKLTGVLFLLIVGLLFMGKRVDAQGAFTIESRIDGYQSVLLQWESDREDYIYQIQRAHKKTGPFETLTSISGQTGVVSSYDHDVVLGYTYYYKVVKVTENQAVEESQVIEMKILLPAPVNVNIVKLEEEQIKLSWNKVEGATGYIIYRSNNKEKGFKKIGETAKAKFMDKNVKGGALYYRVKAVKKKRKPVSGNPSDTVSVYLKPCVPVVMGSYEKNKIKITWKKSEGADTYYVYKKNSKGTYKKLGTTNKLYFTDKKVKKGNYYEYKVTAAYSREGITRKSKKSRACKVLADVFDPDKKMVALTFDDGPGRYTEDIVNCLKKNNGKATFFVLGCNVDSYKNALKAADKIGCQIGNHSYNHKILTKLSEKEIREQISQTDTKVKNVIGKTPDLVRTPGGAISDTVNSTVGKPIILWSIDTLDWKTRSKDKTIKAVMRDIKDGDIVLMHDIYEPTKNAACFLIPKLKQEGYQLVTVGELAKYRGYALKKGTVYRRLRRK